MNARPPKLQRLLGLARRAARPRQTAPTPAPEATELRRLTQQVLSAAERHRPDAAALRQREWARAFERLSWWAAGAAAALCLIAATLHRPASEPTGLELLLQWPARQDAPNPELF